jgi:concanavalin A-like lectin/glucanase superfamily protein
VVTNRRLAGLAARIGVLTLVGAFAAACSSDGGGAGTGGQGGSGTGGGGTTGTGGGGTAGDAAGAGGSAGGAGGDGGGGAPSCAGHAVSFNANVPGNGDPAMARVSVPANTDLPTGNSNRTVEFWAYVLSSSWSADTNTLFFTGSNNRNNDGFGLDFGVTAQGIGTIDPFTNGSTDPQGDNKSSGLMANMNQWAHFAMTWDGTTLRAFVNGVEKVAVPIAMLRTGMTALTIGGYPPAFFNGQIDEFRIWNVAHTAAEITTTMSKTLVGDEPNLTGYWKFDETSGTTAADSVTSAGHTPHPGTLMANTAANIPTFVVSTAPIACP